MQNFDREIIDKSMAICYIQQTFHHQTLCHTVIVYIATYIHICIHTWLAIYTQDALSEPKEGTELQNIIVERNFINNIAQ